MSICVRNVRSIFHPALLVLSITLVSTSGCAQSDDDQAPQTESAAYDAVASSYLTTRDGVRLAADVYLPDGVQGEHYPALLFLTRYQRGLEDPETGKPLPVLRPVDRHLLDHGYALVRVDARGSGASYGSRATEYGRQEVLDAYDVVDWVVAQDWSDGNVGAYGTSYTGTTAELLAAVNHPAVKAVIPGWSDFEFYVSPIRPYGMISMTFTRPWIERNVNRDSNNTEALGASVRRVDEDTDGTLLAAAVAEHSANPDYLAAVVAGEYRDDDVGGGQTWAEIGPLYWKDAIERSGVPMLVLASWMDAGTADGTLLRFQHFSNSQKVVLLASTHGGKYNTSPYTVSEEPLPPQPSEFEQFELRRMFFDYHLKGENNGVNDWPPIRFFNLGEEAFHNSDVWPPDGTQNQTFYMDAGGVMTTNVEKVDAGNDTYIVDPEVTVGPDNRWAAQGGRPVLRLDDRGDMDARMLSYTSEPLPQDMQIAGYPVVTLQLASDREDGVVYIYLEDVDADGRSRYVTEGGLRLIHRKTVPNPYFENDLPYHSFARRDGEAMPPGQAVEVSIQLWPIAVLMRAGHRIRIAIAGADADMFDLIPAEGTVTLNVHRGGDNPSRLVLPVVEGGLR